MSFQPTLSPAEPPDSTEHAPARITRVSTWAGLRRRSDGESIGFDVRAHVHFTISKDRVLGQPLVAATAALYALSLAIGYSSFDPAFTFVFPRQNLFALLYSHL